LEEEASFFHTGGRRAPDGDRVEELLTTRFRSSVPPLAPAATDGAEIPELAPPTSDAEKIHCFPAHANPRKNKDKHLKQRPIPIQRAPDADRVEHLINAHLQQHGPKVADKPIQVKTASRVRKDKPICFQFRCFTWSIRCRDIRLESVGVVRSFAWRAEATKEGIWSEPKRMVVGPPFAVQEVLEYTGEVKQNKFQEWIRRHFANRPREQSLRVHCNPRKQCRQHLVSGFYYGTHVNCPWRGRGKLIHRENENPQIMLKYCNPEAKSNDD